MQRVTIIGCPGAGKSTFGRKLAAESRLPLYYLDMLRHRADRSVVSHEEFDCSLGEILGGDRWIIDGNYLRTYPLRLSRCDTVFFFDLPTDRCLAGAEARLGRPRVDMPWYDEKLDPEFRQWIIDFEKDQKPVIEMLLEPFASKVIRFTSHSQADSYIRSLIQSH